ncbi:MAG TPA: Dabb family protein [Clostridia bacterium]|nr:Dabb family protein [Clostridia bacterium]
MVKHIVCHKYTSKEEAGKIAPMLMGLVGKVPSLRSMQAGADFIGSSRSFHLALVAEFDNREGLEEYQTHPEHVKVKTYIHTVLEESVSVDFEL